MRIDAFPIRKPGWWRDPAAFLRLASVTMTGLGVVLAILFWLQLQRTGTPVDVHWYWAADPNNLYPHPELGENNGYNYSPAFEIVVGWGRNLPFDVFVGIWRIMLLATLVWLAGPFTLFVLLLVPVASEVNAGNIQILLAGAIVAGFRWPGTWSFVLLTKGTPGIGLLWFALRREWRPLAVAIVVTLAIAAFSFAGAPQRWFDWVHLMTGSPAPAPPPYDWSFWQRLPIALAIVAIGAWRGWRWTVPVAATYALPVFYIISPAMLVGVLPFVRTAGARYVIDAVDRLREHRRLRRGDSSGSESSR
jgi:hypothetical protein